MEIKTGMRGKGENKKKLIKEEDGSAQFKNDSESRTEGLFCTQGTKKKENSYGCFSRSFIKFSEVQDSHQNVNSL